MATLLNNTYEILEELGSGGGGVVYLGKHNRLKKLVVLKEDRRSVDTDLDSLRREVDSLKNLSHQYLPQVYDFFQEDEKIYTVMDYIEGESFDKILRYGEDISQADVVHYAIQLLEALVYLHNQAPKGILHADIKPANIMRTPQGDIRLIDFNIALLLGADGAVAVGRSFGYASPEHYGYRPEPNQKRSRQKKTQSSLENTSYRSTTEPLNRPSSGERTEYLGNQTQRDRTEYLGNQTERDRTEYLGDSDTGSYGNETERLSSRTEHLYESNDYDFTEASEGDGTAWHQSPSPKHKRPLSRKDSYTSSGSQIYLDARSDIYGLGATLYHLLCGMRPNKSAQHVAPLDKKKYSKPVITVLEKAMHPDPEQRYQSAEEMLQALRNLRKNDPRTKILRSVTACLCLCSAFQLGLGGYWMHIGLSRQEAYQASLVSAEYSANALAEGNPTLALQYALEALPTPDGKFVPEYSAQGQFALSEVLNLYYFQDGYQTMGTSTLDSEILAVDLSPDGKTALVQTLGLMTLLDVDSRQTIAELPMLRSASAECIFVDNERVFYAGEQGVCLYHIPSQSPLWTGELGTRLAVSNNKEHFASLYLSDSRAFVYSAEGGAPREVDLEGHSQRVLDMDLWAKTQDSVFDISDNGSYLAVSFDHSCFKIFYTQDSEGIDRNFELFEEILGSYSIYTGGFHQDYLVVCQYTDNGTILLTFDFRNPDEVYHLVSVQETEQLTVKLLDSGVYFYKDRHILQMDPHYGEQELLLSMENSKIEDFFLSQDGHIMVLTEDFSTWFYDPNKVLLDSRNEGDNGKRYGALSNDSALTASLDSNLLKILQYQNHPDKVYGYYDGSFSHFETRITKEGNLLLYSNHGLQVYDVAGTLLGENLYPEEKYTYDTLYHRDTDRLEVIYFDGQVLYYDANSGALLEDLMFGPPDQSGSDWFATANYLIYAPVHGNPEVYDPTGTELLMTIDVPDYLCYVTEIGEQILLEFLSTEGERYGLLCNENLDKLVRLPNLCDYVDGYFYFDEGKGNIKREQLYSLEAMLQLAKNP